MLSTWPPVGKSGPRTASLATSRNSAISGSSSSFSAALHTSVKLCGGMLVAMPTAMPVLPFTSRFGTLLGSTTGSSRVPS